MDSPTQPSTVAPPTAPSPPPPPPAPKQKTDLGGWLVLIFGVGLALAGVIGYFLLFSKPQEAAYTGPVEQLRVGNVGEYSVLNLIAEQEGFFAKRGIEATITEYSSGAPGMADMLAGKVDVTVAADFVGVTNIFTHNNIRILSRVSDQDVFRVIARKDKGITEPSDLKGKRVGVTLKSAGEFFLGRFASLHDMALSDFTVVNLPPADMNTQITSGELDAIVIFEPHAYNLINSLKDQVATWSAQEGERTLAVLYSTEQFINANPELTKRYLAALSEAEDFAMARPAEAQDHVVQALKYQPDYVSYLWTKIDFRLLLDQELLLTMEDQARFSIENKLTTQTTIPNYLDHIYFTGMEAVKPNAVTIVH